MGYIEDFLEGEEGTSSYSPVTSKPNIGSMLINAASSVDKAITPKLLKANEAALNLWNQTPYGQMEQFVPEEVKRLSDKVGLPSPIGQGLSFAAAIALPGPGEGRVADRTLQALSKARKFSKVTKPPSSGGSINDTIKQVLALTRGEDGLYVQPAGAKANLFNAYDVSDAERAFPGTTAKQKLRRTTILEDTPAAKEYRALVDKYKKINQKAKSTTIGKDEVKISPLSAEELEPDIRRLVELKTELKLPHANNYRKELGAYFKDNILYRWGSKGELKPEGYEGVRKRLSNQGLIPTDEAFDPHRPVWGSFVNSARQKLTTKLGLEKPEKDHIVRLENQIAILGKKFSKKAGFEDRDPDFMNAVAKELHERGHSIGDQNLNFLQMSEKAHRTGRKSRHVVSQALTDAELPHTYDEADEIFTTLKDGTQKWLKVVRKGKSYILKDGDEIVPNKLIEKKGNYKFNGNEYEKGQRQGLSLDTRRILGSITDPKELADAYVMFADDAGAHEIMSGIQTAASFLYDDADKLDALSKQIRNENIPNMIKFLKYALKNTEYKGDVEYTNLLNRFIDRLEMNKQDYLRDLKFERSLTPLPKSDGRRHVGGDPFKPMNNGATY